MEFFVPGFNGDSTAYRLIDDVKQYTEEVTELEVLPGMAYRIEYWEGGRRKSAMVGRNVDGETVTCILNTRKGKMICTPNHGLGWGTPIMVDHRDVISVDWFIGCAPLQCV